MKISYVKDIIIYKINKNKLCKDIIIYKINYININKYINIIIMEKEQENELDISNNIIDKKITTKEELINNIREWIKLDSEINKMKNEIKSKNNKKKELTHKLVDVMKSNAIDCFDVNGGALVYKTRKTKKPISGKFLLNQLQLFYKDQPNVAEELTKKILENREESIKEEIRRKTGKKKD
jgi:hypothetical protein